MVAGSAISSAMRIQIHPGAKPIEVVKVEETRRDGEPCWVIHAKAERAPLHGGGTWEHTRYVVPQSYAGMREVA